MVTQSIALNLAKQYVSAVQSTGTNVHRAFLFGSYVRNHQHEWSDIDIALIGDDFIGLTVIDKEPFRFLHLQSNFIDIETHTFPTKYLKNSDPFLNEILKTGIEIPIHENIESFVKNFEANLKPMTQEELIRRT
jgi:uncharacterized protein